MTISTEGKVLLSSYFIDWAFQAQSSSKRPLLT
ncbi:hypothetical protein J2129_000706 [Methanofollis sp. W23]|nr:hypothetical protein [Methanofollis sp. W23]